MTCKNSRYFHFFQNGNRRYLDFKNFVTLTVSTVKRLNIRHSTECRSDRSNHRRDMAISFIFPRWRPSFILYSWCVCSELQTTHEGNLVVLITMQN